MTTADKIARRIERAELLAIKRPNLNEHLAELDTDVEQKSTTPVGVDDPRSRSTTPVTTL